MQHVLSSTMRRSVAGLLSKSALCACLPVPLVNQQRFTGRAALPPGAAADGGGRSKLLRECFPPLAMELEAVPGPDGVDPLDTIAYDSARRVQWRCGVCSHRWAASVLSRAVLRNGCPECHRRDNPLLSAAAPKVFSEWHPTRNDPCVDPEQVEATDKGRCWWQCRSCSAQFQARVVDRVRGKGPCPECDRGQLSDFRVNKTLVDEFHPTKNGDMTLAKLRPTDRVPVWWLCQQCGGEWQSSVALRAGRSKQSACPTCAARKKLKGKGSKKKSAANSLQGEGASQDGPTGLPGRVRLSDA